MSRHFTWLRIPLRVQGLLFNSLPLIAVLVTALFAYWSNQQRERTELSLNRHFEMVENLIEIHAGLLNAEAGQRGYLLTHDPICLQHSIQAHTQIPQQLARVRTLLESIPKANTRTTKLALFDNVEKAVNAELATLATSPAALESIADKPGEPGNDISARILTHQKLLDTAGQQLNDLRADEQRLLGKRLDEIRTVRQRDYLLIFLSVFVGLVSRAIALYFFHRRVVRRVRQLTENVRSLRDGSALIHEPSGHTDDIGELERELARASSFLAARRG